MKFTRLLLNEIYSPMRISSWLEVVNLMLDLTAVISCRQAVDFRLHQVSTLYYKWINKVH